MTLLPWRRRARETAPQRSSFEELALPLLPSLYNVAAWIARDTGEAEDVVQETLLKALRGFDSFELGTNFKAWIFRILRNTYLTSRSGLAAIRTVSLDDELGEGADGGPRAYPESVIDRQTPEIDMLRMSDRAALQAAMEKLPVPLLQVILLCDVEELKYKEIAMILEIPMGTVMSRVARARACLRKELEAGSTLSWEARR